MKTASSWALLGAVALASTICLGARARHGGRDAPLAVAARPEAGGQGAPRAAGTAAPDPCTSICARSRALGCPRTSDCATSCQQMVDVTVCRDQMSRVLGCMAREPLASWACGDDGEAALKDGRCDAEQGAFAACARASAPAPTPADLQVDTDHT